MDATASYVLLLGTLAFFGYVGFTATAEREMDSDTFLSARGSQCWVRIGLSLYRNVSLRLRSNLALNCTRTRSFSLGFRRKGIITGRLGLFLRRASLLARLLRSDRADYVPATSS